MKLPDERFIEEARALEGLYLESDDPMIQSGFSGGRDRWVAERSPLVEAIESDGDFLDVGCANGLLCADVIEWAGERGHALIPYGVDMGSKLIELARRRMPAHADNFVSVDAWRWEPDRTWKYVYSLVDLSPEDLLCTWLDKLLGWVEPGGRLIMGSYGSRSRGIEPVDVGKSLRDCGLALLGTSSAGDPPVSRFGWAYDRRRRVDSSSLRSYRD